MKSIITFYTHMKRFCILIFFVSVYNGVCAQYVPIDSSFRKWFVTNGHSECVSGNNLDTTCAGLDSITYINCNYYWLHSLNGVQYLHNLQDLIFEWTEVDSLPALPSSLRLLDCSFSYPGMILPPLPSGLDTLLCEQCDITSLPANLPPGLVFLGAGDNSLTSLPALPSGLQHLILYGNPLTSLPALPQALTYLNASSNLLTSLPSLPPGLQDLDCSFNNLTALPALNSGLLYLDCEYDGLTALPAIPSSLTALTCDNNRLTALPALPQGLGYLYCDHNDLTSLPVLPDTMQSLSCGYNPLTAYPVLPLDLGYLECDSLPGVPIPTLSQNLYYFECMNDNLTSLPASTPPHLNTLICSYNQLTSLAPVTVVGFNLDCSHNQITTLNYANDGSFGSGPGYTTVFPTVNCSYNNLTSVTLTIIPPSNLSTSPPGAVLGDFNCNNNPSLKCLSNLPTMETFEYDSTGITCLPNIPWIVDSSSPSIANLRLCDTGNASGCPAYDFYVNAGGKVNASCLGYGTELNATLYSGYPPFDIHWTPSLGLSNTAILTPVATPPVSMWYYITVIDSIGKQTVDSVFVLDDTLNAGPAIITTSGCSGNIAATVCVPTSGGVQPFKYNWYINGVDSNYLTSCLSNIDTGSYYVYVTDSLGCGFDIVAVVYALKIDSIAATYNCRSGICYATVAAVGGSTPLRYLWSDGDTLASDTGLVPGAYSVTVTDNSGCSVSASVTLAPPGHSTLVFDSVTSYAPYCVNDIGGGCAYPSGGLPPYSYSWSNGYDVNQQCINGFYPGSYTVSVTDSAGCVIDTGFIVPPPNPLSDSLTIIYPQCHSLGSICAYGIGGIPPYYYRWSNGSDSSCAGNVVPGVYDVTVYDAHGCPFYDDTFITGPVPIVIDSFTATNTACGASGTGYLCPVFAANPGVLNYVWSTSATTACLDSVSAGVYTLTISNASGCTATGSATVNQLMPILLTVAAPDTNAVPDSVSLTLSGGSQYYINWGDGQNSGPVGNDSTAEHIYLNNGIFTVVITDTNGCTTNYVFDAGCSDQCVWPGDANYDGVVNNLDLLSIGLAYDSTGYARYNPTINFIPQYCQNWADTLPGGVNYKHADCNGDGTIDANDSSAIVLNYSLSHPRGAVPSPAGGIPVYPYVTGDTVYNSDTVYVEVMLGNSGHQANLVYGIAFTLTYDAAVVDTGQVHMEFSNTWIGTPAEKINLAKNIPQSGSLECAVTRIDHLSKSGQGSIGTATFVITTDNLNGKNYSFYSARFAIEDVTLIDSAGNLLPVTAGYDSTLIGYLPTGIKHVQPAGNSIRLYPNPATNQLEILSSQLPVTGIVINDLIGNEVKYAVSSVTGAGTLQKLDISQLSPGVYTVEVQTTAGTTVQKLVVAR